MRVVIGANWGDEGKGLMTDYLANIEGPDFIVRFNGGAQAGHTVVTRDHRHVFSHFGAGTLQGIPTYLSKFFIVNPWLWWKELGDFRDTGIAPELFIDREALVTTPMDMYLNQQVERKRLARHGSCGVGINETVVRSNRDPKYCLRVADLLSIKQRQEKIQAIKNEWLPRRSVELAVPLEQDWLDNLDDYLEAWRDCTAAMLFKSQVTQLEFFQGSNLLFEGAQGLLLDEDRIDQWPHVTRSKTGLTNVVWIAQRLGIQKLDVTYVTRSYATRHGAGELPGEDDLGLVCKTNTENEFQGSLRYAAFNDELLKLQESAVLDDVISHSRIMGSGNISAGMAITCADQIEPNKRLCPLAVKYVSYGPTRQDVQVTADLFKKKLHTFN